MDLGLLSTVFPTTCYKRIWNRSYGLEDIAFFSIRIKKRFSACMLPGGWRRMSYNWLSASNFACMRPDQQLYETYRGSVHLL